MTTSVWPTGLPCVFQLQGIGVEPVQNTIAIDPEVGSPLTRVRFTGTMDTITGSFVFKNRTQVQTFLTFWRTTLSQGSLPFTFKHPITSATVDMIFMSVPKFSKLGTTYSAAVTLRTMP